MDIVTGHDDTGGEWLNRSRMRNNAAKQAKTDNLIFVDADAFPMDRDFIPALIRELDAGAGIAQIKQIHWLGDKNAAEYVMCQSPGGNIDIPAGTVIWHDCYGLTFAMTRQILETIGGWDERFCGWGEEDPAMLVAINTLVGQTVMVDSYVGHIWHPRGTEHDETTARFRDNKALRELYDIAHGRPRMMLDVIGKHHDWMTLRPPAPKHTLYMFNRDIGFMRDDAPGDAIYHRGQIRVLPAWVTRQAWFSECLKAGHISEVRDG